VVDDIGLSELEGCLNLAILGHIGPDKRLLTRVSAVAAPDRMAALP
jgi:hypothetical protein